MIIYYVISLLLFQTKVVFIDIQKHVSQNGTANERYFAFIQKIFITDSYLWVYTKKKLSIH